MTEEKAKMHLFTSPTCPHCPKAKETAKAVTEARDDVELKEHSTASEDGMKKAKEWQIKVVPTFVIIGDEADQPLGLKGEQNEETLNDFIDAAVGKKPVDKVTKKYS